jgi:dTDP-4-dehydrorhamnose 3,5-epimerase
VRIEPLKLDGAYRIRLDRRGDERGYLERLFCRDAFAALGLEDCSRQISHVVTPRAGTLRGLHFQRTPHVETKLIWICQGAIFDVLVDVRRHSPTYGQWVGMELSAGDDVLIYAPKGLAHGYLSLTDDTGMVYHIDTPYAPDHAAGLRYDDPEVAIAWPGEPVVIGERDLKWPRLRDLQP